MVLLDGVTSQTELIGLPGEPTTEGEASYTGSNSSTADDIVAGTF